MVRHLGSPNCELQVDITIDLDCNPLVCDTVFTVDQIFVPSAGGPETVCLPTTGSLSAYDLEVDGASYTAPTTLGFRYHSLLFVCKSTKWRANRTIYS
ncbi:MAG: hypothetical protein R2784_08120 [Saprospiraceae bacterium]